MSEHSTSIRTPWDLKQYHRAKCTESFRIQRKSWRRQKIYTERSGNVNITKGKKKVWNRQNLEQVLVQLRRFPWCRAWKPILEQEVLNPLQFLSHSAATGGKANFISSLISRHFSCLCCSSRQKNLGSSLQLRSWFYKIGNL